jgi:hypothetical protein
MATPSGAPGSSVLQRAPVQDLRARNSAMTSEDPPVSREEHLGFIAAWPIPGACGTTPYTKGQSENIPVDLILVREGIHVESSPSLTVTPE